MARFLIGCLMALVWAPALAFGGDGAPAVSGTNGKLSVEGGQYDGDQSFLALGSYTLPLGHSFGLQADGALGRIDEDAMGGGGLHLFTRDPSSYLLGVYGSYHTWNSIDIWRAAAEFQLYVRRFSLNGLAGYEGVEVPTTAAALTVLNTDDDHIFGQVDLAYYPIDDLKLYVGYSYVNETSLGGCGRGVPVAHQRLADVLVCQKRLRRRPVQSHHRRPEDLLRTRSRQVAHRAASHGRPGKLHAEIPRAEHSGSVVHG